MVLVVWGLLYLTFITGASVYKQLVQLMKPVSGYANVADLPVGQVPVETETNTAVIQLLGPTVTIEDMTITPVAVFTQAQGLPVFEQPTSTLAMVHWVYSWYWPDALTDEEKAIVDRGECPQPDGKWCHTVNCWDFDVQGGKCVSHMADGSNWRDVVGRALACGPGYALGAAFRIVSPESFAGLWICRDRGASIGDTRLDLLIDGSSVAVPVGSDLVGYVEK